MQHGVKTRENSSLSKTFSVILLPFIITIWAIGWALFQIGNLDKHKGKTK